MLRLRAFGGLTLDDGRAPPGSVVSQPRSLALLAVLANAGERPISRDKVLAYLWPETDAAKAGHRLAQSLYALRRDIGVESLIRASNDLRLNPRVIHSDIQDFTDELERGELRAAVGLYRGPFLDGFYLSDAAEFERWAEVEREEYRRKYRAALEALAVGDGQRGDANESAEWWRRLVDVDPLNARVAVGYMRALSVAAGTAGALQFVRDHTRRLRDEFDSEPEPLLTAAAERLKIAAAATPVGAAIAVLPFLNLTPNRENEYFSDGMTVELASALARVPGLRVVSRTSVLALKDKGLDACQIGERLGVSFLVEGSIRKIGDRIRLNAQVVDAADGCDLWSNSYERTMEHVFSLQEELSQSIAAALPLGQTDSALHLVRQPTTAIDAYTLYLRGRYSANKRTEEGLALGIEYMEQAVEKDPGFALAHAGLAECWALRGFAEFGDLLPCEAMPRAKAAALEALRLDSRLPDGHTWLGVVRFLFDWDWEGAEREFRRALQLQPEQAYAETWYASFLCAMRRDEEAMHRIRHAHALEPLSLSIRLCITRFHCMAGRHEEALASVQAILQDEPGHQLSIIWAMRSLLLAGRFGEALELSRQVPAEHQSPYLRSCMVQALAGLGQRDEVRRLCGALSEPGAERRLNLYVLASAYMRLGDHETALDLLTHCLEMRDGQLVYLLTQPLFARLQRNSRYQRLLEQMCFPAESMPLSLISVD
jgi:serine/threonine-protein kinase